MLEDFTFEAPKTKEFLSVLKNLKIEGKKYSLFCQNQIKTYICLHVTYSALRLSSHLTSIRTKF